MQLSRMHKIAPPTFKGALAALLLSGGSLYACCCVLPCDSEILSSFSAHDQKIQSKFNELSNVLKENIKEQRNINTSLDTKLRYVTFSTKEVYLNFLGIDKETFETDASLDLIYTDFKDGE